MWLHHRIRVWRTLHELESRVKEATALLSVEVLEDVDLTCGALQFNPSTWTLPAYLGHFEGALEVSVPRSYMNESGVALKQEPPKSISFTRHSGLSSPELLELRTILGRTPRIEAGAPHNERPIGVGK